MIRAIQGTLTHDEANQVEKSDLFKTLLEKGYGERCSDVVKEDISPKPYPERKHRRSIERYTFTKADYYYGYIILRRLPTECEFYAECYGPFGELIFPIKILRCLQSAGVNSNVSCIPVTPLSASGQIEEKLRKELCGDRHSRTRIPIPAAHDFLMKAYDLMHTPDDQCGQKAVELFGDLGHCVLRLVSALPPSKLE